jgi:hypothetical protein
MAFGGIGVARRDQRLDHADHLGDVSGRARLDVRRKRSQRRHVVMEHRRGVGGERVDGDAALLGRRHDLVVDVGDVAGIGDARIKPLQQAIEHVEHDNGPRVADMGTVVDRGPAHVHPHVGGIERSKWLLPPGQGVVKGERHRKPFRSIGVEKAASGGGAGEARGCPFAADEG